MNTVRETYFIYLRNLKAWLGQPSLVISTLLPSVFMFLFFGTPLRGMTSMPGFPADDYAAYITGMIIVLAVVMNGADVAFSLLTDMLSGYFDKLLLAPVNRFSMLMGTLLKSGTRALMQVLVIVALALTLVRRCGSGWVNMVAVLHPCESRQAILMAHPRGLTLRSGDRPVLEQWARSQTRPHRQVQRARMLLGLADGRTLAAVGAAVGATHDTVASWRDRYLAEGLAGLADRPRGGRRRSTPRRTSWSCGARCGRSRPTGARTGA